MSTTMVVSSSKVIKSGIWYIAANIVVKGMTLFTTPIFTRLLSKDQFGDYSNYLSWTNIAIIIVTMKMESSLISAKFDYGNRINQYNISLLGLTVLITSTWAFIINFFSTYFEGLTSVRIAYLNILLVYCVFYAAINFYQITERFFYRYKRSVIISLFVAISSTTLTVLLVLNMQDRLMSMIIGSTLPVIVVGFFIFIIMWHKGKCIDMKSWGYALKICIPFVPHLLSLQVLSSIDRVMITKLLGSTDTALYSVAYTCGNMITLLLVSMNSAFAPWLGDMLHEKKYNKIRTVSKYYVLLFCVIATPMMLLAPELLYFMGGKSYMNAMYVMVPVSLGCICQFLYTLFVNVEQYKKQTIGMAFASILAALINYLLNLWLLPVYGYVAAAYTTLLSYLFLLVLHMTIVRIIGMKDVYNYSFVVIVVLIMILNGFLINMSYSHSLIRYFLISVIIIVIASLSWYRRLLIIDFVKNRKRT